MMNQLRGTLGGKVSSHALHATRVKPMPVSKMFRGFSTIDVTSIPTQQAQVPEQRTVIRYKRAPKPQQSAGNSENNNNNNNDNANTRPSIAYTSKRLTFNRADTPPPVSVTQPKIYRRKPSTNEDENIRQCLLLMNRLLLGEVFEDAEREMLISFAKSKHGSAHFNRIFSGRGAYAGKGVASAMIGLFEGRVVELACDEDYGPFFVLNGLALGRKKDGDVRVRDAMLKEFFVSKQNILDSAYTKNGTVLIKSLLEDGTDEERNFVVAAMKGNMADLRHNSYARFVVHHAQEVLPAKQWEPLGAELVHYLNF